MSDGTRPNVGEALADPTVELDRIRKFNTIEIMSQDLDRLERDAREEKLALAVLTLLAGALLPLPLSFPKENDSGARWGIFSAIAIVSVLGIVVAGIVLWFKRKATKSSIGEIRARLRTALPPAQSGPAA